MGFIDEDNMCEKKKNIMLYLYTFFLNLPVILIPNAPVHK